MTARLRPFRQYRGSMLARSVTLNVLGGFGSLAVGFVTTLLLANWLGTADRGLLGIMVTVGSVGLALTGLGLPIAVMYFASRKDVPANALLGNTLAFGALLAVLFIPAFWALHEPIARLLAHGHGGLVWVAAAALMPLTFLDWTTHNQLLGKLHFGLYNALVILSKLATLALVVVLLGVFDLSVLGGLIATAAASAVMIFGSLPTILGDGRPRIDRRLFWEMVRYGGRVQIGSVLQILNYRLDVIVLGLFRPLAAVGYYFVAEFLAELVVTIANAFQSSVLALVSHYEGEDAQGQTTIAAVRHHGILAVAGTVANAVFSPLVILVGLKRGFHPAVLPFFILLPSMWFLGTGTVVQGDLRGRGRPGLSSTYAGVAVVVTVVLDFALIPPFGVVGAAIASFIAYTVYGVASLRGLSRVSGIPARTLVVPTREDLALYPRAARRGVGRLLGATA